MPDQQILTGGREGKIAKAADTVIRPGNPWTPHVHAFLSFLHEQGFDCVPKPCGVKADGREVVSFVDGVVYNDILPDAIMTDEVLADVAALLRRYHDAGAQYIPRLTGREQWMLPARSPVEVMCHGDFAPYNLTFVEGQVHGVIDFDTLHPGPRLWDIAYAAYRWVPFVSPSNPDYRQDLTEQIRRLKLFADRYGMDNSSRRQLPEMMISRIQALVDYMRNEARSGNEDVQKNIEDGHLRLYLDDIAYLQEHAARIACEIL